MDENKPRMAEGGLATTVVVPTIGRPSLHTLLTSLAAAAARGPAPAAVIVVDDRRSEVADAHPLSLDVLAGGTPVQVVSSGGRGPAAARNCGWRRARTPWVSFLDDDVVVAEDWLVRLASDLAAAGSNVAGIQGRVTVPLPQDRRPTDWERGTAGLANAAWITADMTYRRYDLARVGGFDERFPRAFREDADLALRVQNNGSVLVRGEREVTHPVRPSDDWASVRAQRGNADDALMNRLHGKDWWERASAPRGRLKVHQAMTASAVVAALAGLTRRRRLALAAAAAYAGALTELIWRRTSPGPRDRPEVRRMVLSSLVIPPLASWHALRGRWIHRSAGPWQGLPDLVLFDRDGTLVHDVPYNGDPALVDPMPGAREALDAIRGRGIRTGVVTNQSGVGSGRISRAQADAVNAEVERRLGPFDIVLTCPHRPEEACRCRKPAPGMILDACSALGAPVDRCIVVGDIAADIQAANAAGASGILVPNRATSVADRTTVAHSATDLADVVTAVIGADRQGG
jgi:HAD superfamily hydrolase (TIGR01662 family)